MPGEWMKTQLSQVADVIVGGTPSTAIASFWGGEIPWMASGDVHAKRIFDVPGRITIKGYAASSAKLVEPPAVAIGLAGQGKTRGTAALVNTELSTNQSIALIKPFKGSLADTSYLFHELDFRYDELRSSSAGGGRAGLSKGILQSLPIGLPPLPEQRRIAEILDTLDTVIERTEALVQKLKLARAGLLHDLLTRGLDEQGQLRDPELNPETFRESELGGVPKGWSVRPLGEVLTAKEYGVSVPLMDEGRISVLRMNNIQEGEFDVSDLKYSSSPKATGLLMSAGDVLFNRTNSIEHVGKSAIWRGQLSRVSFASYMVRLVPKHDVLLPEFLTLWLNDKNTRIRVKRYSTPAVQQVNINPTSLGKVVIGIPSSILEQRRIAETLEEFRQRIRTEQAQLAKLRQLKRGLMEDLLTGRVRVGAEAEVEDSNARAVVLSDPISLPVMPDMPPPVPIAAQTHVMYRASPGANPAAQNAWVEQLRDAVAGQQVGTYSPAALDALLPELAALTLEPEGVLRVPELLARVGIRFMLLAHPVGSRTSGAAFYLDESARTQPVVALSLLRPYLDVFWFNLLHELGHIRLGHTPVHDEELGGKNAVDSPDEQAANAFARQVLIPEELWAPFLAAELHDSNRIHRFAHRVGQHHSIVAGRLGTDTGEWSRFNAPELRPQIRPLLDRLAAKVKP